jgi:hypothetical protein
VLIILCKVLWGGVWMCRALLEVGKKCIFASFSGCLRFRMFTVVIFRSIFHFIFHFILIILLPNNQKWSKNEAKNEPKMAQKWLLWTTLIIGTPFPTTSTACLPTIVTVLHTFTVLYMHFEHSWLHLYFLKYCFDFHFHYHEEYVCVSLAERGFTMSVERI